MTRNSLRIFFLAALVLLLSCQQAQPPSKVAEKATVVSAPVDSQTDSAETIKFRPTRDQYYYLFGCGKPVMKVNPGNRMLLWTEDAVNGRVKAYEDIATKMPETEGSNPQTGPFYVNGAAPGDTLALKIVDIQPAESQAWSWFSPRFGFMFTNDFNPVMSATVPELVWLYPVNKDKWTVTFQARNTPGYKAEIPMHPFMGTIGTAPDAGECHDSMTARWSGGNMDCVETKAGATVYLPVNVAGAMWSIGDCHLVQGDGESCGTAVECRSWVTVQILPLIKGKKVRTPRIGNDEYLMSCGNARPLDSAYKIAYEDMINWLVDGYGFNWMDAYQLMSQVSPVRVGNVVDPNFTVVVKFPKKYLPKK